jgi:hypothetical protein
MFARSVNGPYALSDSEFKRSGANIGLMASIKSKLSQQAFGKLTDDEMTTLEKAVKFNAQKEAQELNRIATEYTSKAEKYGVPGDLIVLDSKDFGDNVQKKKDEFGFESNQKSKNKK